MKGIGIYGVAVHADKQERGVARTNRKQRKRRKLGRVMPAKPKDHRASRCKRNHGEDCAHVYLTLQKVNVYSFTGLDLEVVGRVMENGRNKKDRVGTILLAQKNYATGKTGVFTPRHPFAYLNLDQVDSLVMVLNEIVKESYNWQQYPTEITYVADGGLMVQYYGVQQKVFFKNVAPSDRIDSFDYTTYSKCSFYGYSIEVKVQKELPQIVDALQRAKREVEDYLNFR